MLKRIAVGFIMLCLIAATGCSYRREVPPDNNTNQNQQGKIPEEDKLAKTDKEAVEENINGLTFEDDLKITDSAEDEVEDRTVLLSQEERNQLLNQIGPKKINTILEEFDSSLPDTIVSSLQYTEYQMAFDYFLVTAEAGAKVMESPSPDAVVIAEVANLDKASLLQRAEGKEADGSDIWYRVAFKNGEGLKEGYINSTAGAPRGFHFDKMQEAIGQLRQQLAEGPMHFISNYKNQNGTPPQIGEESVDAYGYRFYHSAPAYTTASTEAEFRYIPDGILVRLLEEAGDFYHVNVPTFGGNYYVPKQYIDPDVTLSELSNVVVVDRGQQNQAAFEVDGEGLNLISYTLSTTGYKGEYSFETTLGSYKAIEKRERFEYIKNGTQEIAGYAPYAIRFTGGAYIHGVPVAYKEENGEKIDPGVIEYLHTIGTFPRSNMCVRNYTSHAEFLYNWMDTQRGAVIVIE